MIDKKRIKEILDNKTWKRVAKPYIMREVLEVSGAVKEKISIRVFEDVEPDSDKMLRIMIKASYDNFPVEDDRDYLEFEDLINNSYLCSELSCSDFDKWAGDDLVRFFPVILSDVPLFQRVYTLNDECFFKEALICHVDGSLSFLSWYRQD